jgi:streptogramin lyase
MCQTSGVLGGSTRWVGRALGVAVVACAAVPASAGAVAGTITHYPIPIETTPYGLTTGPDGKIWIVDSGNHVGGTFVGRMATSGAASASDFVQLPSSGLGLAGTLGPDGNMWVAQDAQIDRVPVGVSLTSEITPFALGSGTGGYGSIVPGPDGRLWFGWNKEVGAITTAGSIEGYETKATSAVSGVTVGPEGKLWFGEGNAIARMDTSGHIGAGDEFPLPVGDNQINGLVLGPDGNIWFSLAGPAAVGRITPAGTITLFPTPTAASLPFGLAVGPDKKIWFAERNADAIASIPTTATSGADIVEYPVGSANAGVLYVTAGPDGRMWFTEFNRGSLGAITTDAPTVSSIPPIGKELPLGLTPAPAAELPALSPNPAPVACLPNKLVLTDVFPQGGKTEVLGVAPSSAVGKTVAILSSWNHRTVAKVKVAPDLSFKAEVALPPRSLRFSNRAVFTARLGSVRTGALKFARRMYTTAITASGRSITFRGIVTPPLAKRIEPVAIRIAASCASIAAGTTVATTTPTRTGAYSATLELPPSLQNAEKVYLQAQTRVRQNAHSKKTFPSSTLIRGVRLTP